MFIILGHLLQTCFNVLRSYFALEQIEISVIFSALISNVLGSLLLLSVDGFFHAPAIRRMVERAFSVTLSICLSPSVQRWH